MNAFKTECPNCQAIWGMEEIEDQSCGACGWPNNDDDEDFDEEDFDDHDNREIN